MKTPLITFLIAGFLIVLASRSDFLDQKPSNEEIVGKWEITWIAPSVAGWVAHKGNGIHTLPKGAGIEFQADGSFTASGFPYSLDSTDRCIILSRPGRWQLIDSTADGNLVNWEIALSAAGAPTTIRLPFHKDSEGVYLDNPIDIEASASVILRRRDSIKN